MQISKISQRTFAESLLSMKQANFSFLLSHPLSWSELSKTYRDRFLVMYMWLNDPNRMAKLAPNETKRRSTGSLKVPVESKYSFSSAIQSSIQKERQKRIKLRSSQVENLKKFYDQNQYPSSNDINTLAIQLNLPPKKVSTWFIHQRQISKPVAVVKR